MGHVSLQNIFLKNSARFFIDEARNSLDTSTTGQAPDRWLCDALAIVAQHLPVALGTSFSQALSTFSASSHRESSVVYQQNRRMSSTRSKATHLLFVCEPRRSPFLATGGGAAPIVRSVASRSQRARTPIVC